MSLIAIGAALSFALSTLTTAAAAQVAAPSDDPVALVDTFVGTSGDVNTFPGADAPFGMLQWSPDTTSRPPGGGYEFDDTAITGFSLTHLSGPGCAAMGDFPFLPVVGDSADPDHASQPFAHADESASPGSYSVKVGSPAIQVRLAAGVRSGIGQFTFPPTKSATLIVKTAGSAAGDTDAHFAVDSPVEIEGSATTGHFCDTPDEHSVYFVAQFDRPMTSYGAWTGTVLQPGAATSDGARSGGWLTFDATQTSTVTMRVGISFVSIAGARANLAAERSGWDVDALAAQSAAAWRAMLSRVEISGGTPAERRIFYTSLYHALLHPNVFSDADGAYMGFDGATHEASRGHVEYANYSGWDIYRSQIPLLALVYPVETSDMMRSLVDEGAQGGWLPKWPLANQYTDAMNGDSADPILAEAYAFGARGFDALEALRLMVKGATALDQPPGQGWYVARPDLGEYLRQGWVANSHTNSISPLPNSASETLEYALDDFAISRLAGALGDEQTRTAFWARSENWANLFDTATGRITPRDADGSFVETPLTPKGQSGFQEGNAAQYTWLVPQDLRGLFDAMGGDAAAISRLDDFFSRIDAGPGAPYAWAGNEPSILQPYFYLSADQPWKTQALLRRVETTMYADAPAGEAGNDDLGTMSSWYVWSAIGLYPQTPGEPLLVVGSPLFSSVTIRSEDGRSLAIHAPEAADGAPYVAGMRVNGRPWSRTWLSAPTSGTLTLDFDLASTPDLAWGSAPGDGPPSWGKGRLHLPPTTTSTLGLSPGAVRVAPGEAASFSIVLGNARGSAPVTADWASVVGAGIATQPGHGRLTAPAGGATSAAVTLMVPADAPPGFSDVVVTGVAAGGAPIHRAVATVQVRAPGVAPDFAYVMNFSDGSVTPIDLRSRTYGPRIPTGADPGDGALSLDRSLLFIADQGSNDVSVVDTDALALKTRIPVGKVPAGIRLTPDGSTIWVSDYGDDDIRPIDVATLRVGAPLAVGHKPEELAISPDGRMLYVVDQGIDMVTPVDLRTRRTMPPIRVGRTPIGIVLTPDGKTAFVTDMGSNDVTPIDLSTLQPKPSIAVGRSPQQPAISPDGSLLLVPNAGSRSVTPISVATGAAGPPILVGNGPFDVEFAADGRTAFVVNTGDDVCVPVDVATRTVGTPIATGAFPIAIVR